MQIINMIVYTGITLGVLVFIHELGHFLAAKLTGMRVDRFSLGFPPRAFGKKIGETDYCISWLPLGGYVKIAGMIDESFDTDFLSRPPEPWEFRAKPLWARVMVISAGVIMNVLLATFIFSGINYTHGRLIEKTTEIANVVTGSPAEKAGIHPGDKVLSVNGTPVEHWAQIQDFIYLDNFGKDITLAVDRKGEQATVFIPRSLIPENPPQPLGLIKAHTVVMVGEVAPGKPGEKLGLKPGDIIVSLDDVPVVYDSDVIRSVRSHAGRPLHITWRRGDQSLSGTATPTDSGRLEIGIGNYYTGPSDTIRYSLVGALVAGTSNVIESTTLFYKSIGQVIVGKASLRDNIGGPYAIAQLATKSAENGLASFLSFMALLSMSLAILNILPFPVLDGGHLAMMVAERIFGKEIPPRIKLGIQKAGFIILLAFMAFVIYNDFTRSKF